ncbi:hypothetical protein E4O09_08915, partial [Campylobacter jejuni]|nr:hypothetical protein [Campylobacter jejuni]
GKSNEIDLKSLLGQNLNFDKTKFNITINKFFNSNFNISHFIQKNLDLKFLFEFLRLKTYQRLAKFHHNY